MAVSEGSKPKQDRGIKRPSEEFAAYCEAEFERRLNSGEDFNETLYRRSMTMVLDRLERLEQEGKA